MGCAGSGHSRIQPARYADTGPEPTKPTASIPEVVPDSVEIWSHSFKAWLPGVIEVSKGSSVVVKYSAPNGELRRKEVPDNADHVRRVTKDVAASDAADPTLEEDIRDKYEMGEILGSGSFGQVRKARLKVLGDSSDVRAVKMIERDEGDGEWSNQAIFVREVGLLQQIKHKNIVQYFDFYEDPHFLYVVMELCTGGELFAKMLEIRRFSEKDASRLGQQMLSAIDYIHQLHIVHRDVKGENFMLSEPSIGGSVKMIDFGMATKFTPGKPLTTLCGSPHYLSPELIGQKYNNSVDVWAFGVLLYLIMHGHYPHDAKHPRDIMVKILTEPVRWQTKTRLSDDAVDFLQQLLERNPNIRITAQTALQHKWMTLATNASPAAPDAGLLSREAVRNAHKKITANRKTLDPKTDQARNEKLKKIDEDYSKGIRHGQRLGETPKEEFMSKPEFIRRENKIISAPSRELRQNHYKVKDMINGINNKQIGIGLETIRDGDADAVREEKNAPMMGRQRSHSVSHGAPTGRRLSSYLGTISKQEESNLASLYEEKRGCMSQLFSDVVPGSPKAA